VVGLFAFSVLILSRKNPMRFFPARRTTSLYTLEASIATRRAGGAQHPCGCGSDHSKPVIPRRFLVGRRDCGDPDRVWTRQSHRIRISRNRRDQSPPELSDRLGGRRSVPGTRACCLGDRRNRHCSAINWVLGPERPASRSPRGPPPTQRNGPRDGIHLTQGNAVNAIDASVRSQSNASVPLLPPSALRSTRNVSTGSESVRRFIRVRPKSSP